MSIHGTTLNTRHREERELFGIFFSLLNNMPEHRGIYRRWEKEVQRAERFGESWCMSNVWLKDTGYVRTLQYVKKYFSRGGFGTNCIEQLAGLAAKVLQRRQQEYERAVAKGWADNEHRKALEEWKRLMRALENKASRVVVQIPSNEAKREECVQNTEETWFKSSFVIVLLILAFVAWIYFK